MVIKTCIVETCKFIGDENLFKKGKNTCKKCYNLSRRGRKRNQLSPKALAHKKEYDKAFFKRSDVKEQRKKYHREYSREYSKRSHVRDKKNAYKRSEKYKKKRNAKRKNNPQCKISENLRSRIRQCVKNKTESSSNLLGCPIELFLEWLEFNFDENMSWDNYGEYWHMDHVIPCRSFDLSDTEQQFKCFNWTNVYPLEGRENESKNDKIIPEYIDHVNKKFKLFTKKFINEHVIDW